MMLAFIYNPAEGARITYLDGLKLSGIKDCGLTGL
jgi:hypothetical protein